MAGLCTFILCLPLVAVFRSYTSPFTLIYLVICLFVCLCSPTKASLYGAILFTLQEAHWLPVSKSTLILVFTFLMATSKVGSWREGM